MQRGYLDIPQSHHLPRTDIKMPYFLVADNIFALQKHLMKPYSRGNLTYSQKIYNYRISRARLTIECSFGLLTTKWAFLQRKYGFKLSTFENTIIAVLCLHNLCITRKLEENDEQYRYPIQDDEENDEKDVNLPSYRQRQLLEEYFLTIEGSVPWQDQCI